MYWKDSNTLPGGETKQRRTLNYERLSAHRSPLQFRQQTLIVEENGFSKFYKVETRQIVLLLNSDPIYFTL